MQVNRIAWTSPATVGMCAGVLGILIPGIGLFILPIWDFPATDATSAQVSTFVTVHRSGLQAVMLLTATGVALWLIFGLAVWAGFREKLRPASVLTPVFGAGVISLVTLLLAGFAVFDVLVYRSPGTVIARPLYDLAFGLLAISGLPTAIALGAYAAAVYRHGLLPQHTAHLAVAAGIAHVALLLSFVIPSGFLSLEGQVITVVPGLLWAWILVTSLCLHSNAPNRADRLT